MTPETKQAADNITGHLKSILQTIPDLPRDTQEKMRRHIRGLLFAVEDYLKAL